MLRPGDCLCGNEESKTYSMNKRRNSAAVFMQLHHQEPSQSRLSTKRQGKQSYCDMFIYIYYIYLLICISRYPLQWRQYLAAAIVFAAGAQHCKCEWGKINNVCTFSYWKGLKTTNNGTHTTCQKTDSNKKVQKKLKNAADARWEEFYSDWYQNSAINL